MRSILLASASPRRRDLLESLGLEFSCVPAPVEEHLGDGIKPEVMVLHNAELKADWVAAQHPASLVIAADTTVALGGYILNKPVDMDDARSMLRMLSGKTHAVHTGISLVDLGLGIRKSHIETSRVTFKVLDEPTIDAYCACASPLERAGACSILEGSEYVLDHYEGSHSNIVGLPLEWLQGELISLGSMSQAL